MAADKYNYKRLVKDLRAGDDDIAIFALRTVIKVERGQFGREGEAIDILTETINELMPNWPSELRFYGQRAVEHLAALKAPVGVEFDEDVEHAVIDLDDLGDEDIRRVIHCLKKIEAQKYGEAADRVRELLKSGKDPLLLGACLSTLATIGSSSDLFLVRQFVTHTNGRVRSTCIEAIQRLADDPGVAVGMIEPFLKDHDGATRGRAIKFIGQHEFSKVEPAIAEMLDAESVADRTSVAEALCSITAERVVPFLKRVTDDPDETVRLKVLEAIEKTEHPQKAFILKKLVKDGSANVLKVAREALRRYETKRMLSIGGFQNMLPDDLPAHKRIKNLEDIQDEEELDPINLDDLKDPLSGVKLQCLQKIRQRHHEKAYQQVIEMLGVAENVEILTEAIRCLTVIGTNRDVEAIMHFVNHVAPLVRAAAAEAIEQLANKVQIIFLLLPMVHDEAPEVRRVAARAVLRFNKEDILSAIAKMSDHGAKAIRYRLVQFLTNYSGHAVLAYFGRAAGDEKPAIRRVVAQAMFAQTDPRSDTLLDTLCGDTDERVRTEAARSKAAKTRRRESGAMAVQPLPDLNQVIDVARSILQEAEATLAARAADEERAAREAARQGDLDSSTVQAFMGKVGSDMTARKELEMLELNRAVILADMGQKVYKLIQRQEVSHAKYDRVVFLIKKFKHLETQAPGKHGGDEAGFWARRQQAAGVEARTDGTAQGRGVTVNARRRRPRTG